MPLRSLILDHFWLKLFSLILATLIWLTVRGNLSSASAEQTRTFLNRPILVLTDTAEHAAVTVNPSQATVTVRGPASLIQELAEQDIHVFVRMVDRHQFSGELPVHAHVPSGANVALVTPTTTTVRSAASP
jgi:YbbR domain-containing protein